MGHTLEEPPRQTSGNIHQGLRVLGFIVQTAPISYVRRLLPAGAVLVALRHPLLPPGHRMDPRE